MFNYKGIFYDRDSEKYTCPATGAHFDFTVLCQKLELVRKRRVDKDSTSLAKSEDFDAEDLDERFPKTLYDNQTSIQQRRMKQAVAKSCFEHIKSKRSIRSFSRNSDFNPVHTTEFPKRKSNF
jgi:hypothetical protein